MDKNAIKKYAVWARTELIDRVSQKALKYGITEKDSVPASATSVNGVVLSKEEMAQRKALLERIAKKGYKQVMEEVAYTWFNRFSALRFMEVNGYLPSRVRVFTDENNQFEPQIIAEAIDLEIDGLDREKVYAYKDANDAEGLFKYLIIVQCNALSPILPGMFQRIADYTELLFPDNLLREGSTIQRMIEWIPEEDWKDAVQIIGWLYQYYNTEPKDKVFADLKKNIKVSKENIPAATQIFTPDWIVRYMVENSLGRLWIEGHPDENLRAGWAYYVDEAEQEPQVKVQLEVIRKEYAGITPEQIKCIDPCSGSGHICAYMFDVLMQIYEAYGYTAREAVRSIVENNIYGLDIDERAAQLAYFSVMMKARQYDRRYLTRKNENGAPDVPQPHVYEIVESNGLDRSAIEHFIGGDPAIKNAINSLISEMYDAKEYGSILNITPVDFDALYRRFDEVLSDISIFNLSIENELLPFVRVAEVLSRKYHIVSTNPPYMGSNNFNPALSKYIKDNYAIVKEDLYSCMIERCNDFCYPNYFISMITMESWMFNTTFEKFRIKFFGDRTVVNMVHMPYLGKGGTSLGISFGTAAYIIRKRANTKYDANYYCVRYYETDDEGVPCTFPVMNEKANVISLSKLAMLPGKPMSYWAHNDTIEIFASEKSIADGYGDARQGLKTSDNERFLRRWYEINYQSIGFDCPDADAAQSTGCKWFPYNKGGKFRKWYGNDEYVIDWSDNGQPIKQAVCTRYPYLKGNYSFVVKNESKYFLEQVTWTTLTSGKLSFRYKPVGYLFDGTGSSIFTHDKTLTKYLLGLMNSDVGEYLLGIIGQTMSYEVGMISKVPVIYRDTDQIVPLIEEAIALCKADWDTYETSWNFIKHPLVGEFSKIADATRAFLARKADEKARLIECEKQINTFYSNVYGIQPITDGEEYSSIEVPTTREVIIGFISYAVGCMFGRYSLEVDGIAYAGGEWDDSKYVDFKVDKDSIIPICDDEYFTDDIVGRFIHFVGIVYGKENLQDNLRFIADALGGSGQPKDAIRKYFMNDFYTDHLKMYQKRPIYWQFDSGKKGGFKALVYMHRYQPDTIARMRTDYVHEQQARYRTAIADLEQRIASASTSERVKLNKRLKTLQEQATEIQGYEEKIHHLADQYIAIDLDDGVKKNYEIFKDVLAKIK